MFHPEVVEWRLAKFERAMVLAERPFKFERRSLGEVDYYNAKLLDAFDLDGNRLRSLTPDEDKFIFNELNLSALDYRYWVERYAMILSDTGDEERVVLRGSQLAILEFIASQEYKQWKAGAPHIKLYEIVMKARQLGVSVFFESVKANMVYLNNGTRGLIGSDHEDTSITLWNISTMILDNLPVWMRPKTSLRQTNTYLKLEGLNSEFTVAKGNQKTTMGQSKTLDVVHLSEVSTWEFPRVIDADVLPAFNSSRAPVTIMALESTGAGMDGWLPTQWEAAQAGNSVFQPLFVGWFLWKDKYSMPSEGVVLNDKTLELAARVKREHDLELSREQLTWYQVQRAQYDSKGELETFLQEFPTFVEEAFQAGAPHVFPYVMIQEMREKAETPLDVFEVDRETGKIKSIDDSPIEHESKLRVWDYRMEGGTYVIGCDPATGLGSDNSGIFVNLAGTTKWLDEQVAEWYGKIDAFDLAIVLKTIGEMYPDDDGTPARICIEINPAGGGLQTQQQLMKLGYPNLYVNRKWNVISGGWTQTLGWYTNLNSRALLTNMGVKWLRDHQWNVHSKRFISEMWTFLDYSVQKGRRHLEHAPSAHDDNLFAGFLALMSSHEDDLTSVAQDRLEATMAARKRKQERKRGDIRDMVFDEGLTWDEAIDRWAQRDWEN